MMNNVFHKQQEDSISVLLIEEDLNWANFLKFHLEKKGIQTQLCNNGEVALEMRINGFFNFCICGLFFQNTSIFKLIDSIRQKSKHIPVLVFSKNCSEQDVINSFKAGADECMSRPCSIEELCFRIQAIYNRYLFCPKDEEYHIFPLGQATFDSENQIILKNNGTKISLSGRESELLKILCMSKGKIVERYSTLESIWHNTSESANSGLDVYISKLRKLLKAHTSSRIINVHGVGYRFICYSKREHVLRKTDKLYTLRQIKSVAN